jgi:hypothetical protein
MRFPRTSTFPNMVAGAAWPDESLRPTRARDRLLIVAGMAVTGNLLARMLHADRGYRRVSEERLCRTSR